MFQLSRHRIIIWFFTSVLIMLLLSITAEADSSYYAPVIRPENTETIEYQLNSNLYCLPETSRGINIYEAKRLYENGAFKHKDRTLFFGKHKKKLWFCTPLTVNQNSGQYYFVIKHYYLDEIDLYIFKDGKLIKRNEAGINIPSTKEEADSFYPSFSIDLQTGNYLVLFSITSKEVFLPLFLMDAKTYVKHNATTLSAYTFVYTLLLFLVFINLYFMRFEKTMVKSIVYYIVLMVSTILYHASRSGYLNYFFWPDSIYLTNRFYLLILAPATFSLLLLVGYFLKKENDSNIFKPFLSVCAVFSIIYILAILIAPDYYLENVISIGYMYLLFLFIFLLYYTITRIRHSDISGKILSYSLLGGIVMFIIAVMKTKGIMSIGGAIYFTMAGTIIISIGNLFASMFRINRIALEKEATEARLKAAGYQLLQNRNRPHFLMNTFSLLSTLINKQSDTASKVVALLTNDFHYYTNMAMRPLVPLSREIDFIQNYLHLLFIRFDEKLDYSISIDTNDCEFLIPPFSLQPLVENAVKNSLVDKEGRRTIKISVSGSQRHFNFSVSNPADAKSNTAHGETHRNITARMEYYFSSVALTLNLNSGIYKACLYASLDHKVPTK